MPLASNDLYAAWAKTLAERFFGLHIGTQRARLVVTRSLLDEDYPHLGGSAGFLDSVRRGPRFFHNTREDSAMFHSHALALYRLWKTKPDKRPKECFTLPDDAPLYLPHLACLCIGWTVNPDDEELPANAFYDRLSTILPGNEMGPNQLSMWRKLWDGLEDWTNVLNGRRGIFKVEILGHFCHVGIPLSQVLLTPSRISRLPELFVTTGLADNWENADESNLRHILVANESRTRGALGGLVFREIQDEESMIGKAALERLLEYLNESSFREWPPSGLISTKTKVAADGPRRTTFNVRLVLEKIELPDSWNCRFGVLGEQPPDASTGSSGWYFTKAAETLGGLWLASNEHSSDSFIDASEWVDSLQRGLSINCVPTAGQDEDEALLRLTGRGIRVFHETGWIGQRLVEEDCLPSSGGCFILVAANAIEAFSTWADRFRNHGGTVSDFTREGLPEGSSLLHLDRVELAGEQLIKDFPEGSVSKTKSKSCLYLRGGSQLQGTGQQQVYLPYDPPDVVLVAPDHVRLESAGATLEESTENGHAWSIPEGMPGLTTRQFRLEISPEANQIRITTVSDEAWIPQVVTFGVGREAALGANFAEDAEVRFDHLGRRHEGVGILGSIIDDTSWDEEPKPKHWEFDERNIELGNAASLEDTEHSGWCLLEALAQSRRVSTREFRRLCERILGMWPRNAWSEARWIRALCHVEVERDNRGRIAYIYPVPAHAYLLPWKRDGQWLVSLGGCPTRTALRKLLDAANELSVGVHAKHQESWIVPPRWLCSSENLDAIQLVLEEAGIQIAYKEDHPLPLSATVAEWSASLTTWKSGLAWLDGAPPAKERIFNPRHFHMSSNEAFSCPYKLISITDSITEKHQWNMLHYNGGWQGKPSHAFLLDPSWGKWLSMLKIAAEFPQQNPDEEKFRTPLPFVTETNSLHVPASLAFPTLLSRALVACTGMSPATLLEGSPQYKTDSQFTPCDEPAYVGVCHRYDDLHPSVVGLTCAKVGAKPVEI